MKPSIPYKPRLSSEEAFEEALAWGTKTGLKGSEPLPLDLPPLYALQRAALYDPCRISVIEASTKSGKTVGSMIWILDLAWHQQNREFWWIAPTYAQAEFAWRRYAKGFRGSVRTVRSPMRVELPSGSRIIFKSGEKPDNLYGEDVWGCVIDEASRVREESWHAIRSTLTATRGPIRAIGNVVDRVNWFHRLCRRAEHGDGKIGYHRITSDDAIAAGILAAEEIADAKRDLPRDVFNALYRCIPPEGSTNPFGTEAEIMACAQPLADTEPWVWGWDLARDRNYTVGVALDRDGKCCRFERRHGLSWRQQIPWIVDCVGEATALVDATGPGSMPVEELQYQSSGMILPFLFTSPSKQRIMEALAVAIQRAEITYPEGPLTSELLLFEHELTRTGVRYRAPDGCHDDCVDALALAHHQLRTGVIETFASFA